MLIQTSNLDGSNPVVQAMLGQINNQGYVDDALSQSANKIVVCGEGLDSQTPTDKVINIVAVDGHLISHNLDGVTEPPDKQRQFTPTET